MKVLIVSTECAGFASTGVLGEEVAKLAAGLRSLGHDARIIMPRHRRISTDGLVERLGGLPVQISSKTVYGRIFEGSSSDGVPAYFIDQPEYFDRAELYCDRGKDYADNAERFVFFSRASVEFLRCGIFTPDVVSAHDWFTGLVPVYLKTLYAADNAIRGIRSAMTIHTIAYQGIFWHYDMHLTCLPWSLFTYDKLEFHGKINFLKGGIAHADLVTATSAESSAAFRTKAGGCGLDGILNFLGERFRSAATAEEFSSLLERLT